MYICEECGTMYDDAVLSCEESCLDVSNTLTCTCGGRLLEAKKCIVCGQIFGSEDYVICDGCVENGKTLDNVLSIGSDCTENISINGFIAFYFGNHISELEDILIKAILEKTKYDEQVVLDSIQRYCDFDKSYFIEWLEDKWNTER